MLSPENISKIDQGIALMREFYPPALWALYESSQEQGFSESQAMEIVKHWLTCSFGQITATGNET